MKTIVRILFETAEAIGQNLSEASADMMLEELVQYPADAVAAALADCRRSLKGRLTLADILERLHAKDGHPDADEAWGIAVAAVDENKTLMMTEPISQALAIARPLLELGDKVGARLAFVSAYRRLLNQARALKQSAVWWLSFGQDTGGREAGRQQAIDSGRLGHAAAQALLLDAGNDRLAQVRTDAQRAQLERLRGLVREAEQAREDAKRKAQRLDRIRTYLLKRKARTQYQQYQQRQTQAAEPRKASV